MAPSIEYWLGAIGGSLLVGAVFGLIALYIGAIVGEVQTAKRVFIGFIVVSFFGGLKSVGILFVPLIWPIFAARKKTKQRLAQQRTKPDDPASGGSAS